MVKIGFRSLLLVVSGIIALAIIVAALTDRVKVEDQEATTTTTVEETEMETTTSTTTTTTTTTTTETTTTTTTKHTTTTTPTTTTYSKGDLELVAHLRYGEAGDQRDEVQRAVGTVLMNRVKHKLFPNTIYGVIHQHGQYACTWDGNFDRKPSEQAYRNARWVLNGNRQFGADYVFQAQFKQGHNCIKLGSEWFGTYSP